jgi:hypothetical protein
VATLWLVQTGHEVFRNVSSHGIADLVAVSWALKTVTYVEVKSGQILQNGTLYPTPKVLSEEQIKAGVRLLVVADDGWIGWADEHPSVLLRKVVEKHYEKPAETVVPT